MEESPEQVPPPKDIDRLYSEYSELLREKGDLSTRLAEVRSDIIPLERDELANNPELDRLFGTFVERCRKVRSVAATLDGLRVYYRELNDGNTSGILDAYHAQLKVLRDLQEKIEDTIRLLVEQRGERRGLFVLASDLLDSVQPLFLEQDDKDTLFKGFENSVEHVVHTREISRKPATLSAHREAWRVVKNKMLPSVHAHTEMQNRFKAGLCSAEDVRAAREYRLLTLRNVQAHLDTVRGLAFSEIIDLKNRVHTVMHPSEPVGVQSAATPPIQTVRQAHQRARAAYAAVQHTLSVEQRIEMRKQIAQLSSLVREAELAHAVSHATEHAPALAHATLTSDYEGSIHRR